MGARRSHFQGDCPPALAAEEIRIRVVTYNGTTPIFEIPHKLCGNVKRFFEKKGPDYSSPIG